MAVSKTVSKSAYIGLDDLSVRISKNQPPKNDLIRYFICLCTGKTDGNGAIANKLEITPVRVDVFNSWLYKANLISEDGKPTEYGDMELHKLAAEQKNYVAGLLRGDEKHEMQDELNYFLRLGSNGNSASHKEPDNIPAAIMLEKHEEPIIEVPLPTYVEKKESFGDMLAAVSETSNPELLEEVSVKKHRRTGDEVETLKYAILGQILRGVGNKTIAKNVDISPAYVSVIVRLLKDDDCVEGSGKRRHITPIGIEMLNPHKAEDRDVPVKVEPVIQVSEEKSSSDMAPITQVREEINPFPSESYGGIACKTPFGPKQIEKYTDKCWYAKMSKSEGQYAKSKEKTEPSAEEPQKSITVIEEIHNDVPTKMDETVIPATVDGVLETDTDTEPAEMTQFDADLLKFLLGVEFKLTHEELAILFEGNLYLFESQIRRSGYFTKSNDLYSLKKTGSDKLDSLKQECREVVPEYLDIITYLRENKKMPPKAEPEEIIPAADTDEIVLDYAGEEQEPPEPSVSVPVQPAFERSAENPEISLLYEAPQVLLLYAAPKESPEKNPVPIQEITHLKSEETRTFEPVILFGNPSDPPKRREKETKIKKTKPAEVGREPPIIPLSMIKQGFTNIAKKSTDYEKRAGMHYAGWGRMVVLLDGGQKTIFSRAGLSNDGLEYLEILNGNGHGKKFSDNIYEELRYLGWITGRNGDAVKTEKGGIAEVILKELNSPADDSET